MSDKIDTLKLQELQYNNWNSAFERVSKAMLAMTSGALALSPTILNLFKSVNAKPVILISWICLVLSIVFQIFTMTTVAASYASILNRIKEAQEKDQGEEIDFTTNSINKWGNRYFFTSLLLFITGLLLLGFFAFFNLSNLKSS